MRKCYNETKYQDIFEDLDRPIDFSAIGYKCNNMYCFNSSHFLSLGVIPSLDTPSYYDLRNRAGSNWYSDEMAAFLNSKLSITNKQYTRARKLFNMISKCTGECMHLINVKFIEKIKYNIVFVVKYLFPLGKKAILIGTSEHENLGDSAIAVAEKLFLAKSGYSPNHIKEITYTEYIEKSGLVKRYIGKNWLICGLGGGSMGNQWFYDEEMRRSFIEAFPSNKIIIFPQTIFYTDDKSGKKAESDSIPCYEGHKNLVVAAREKASFEIMKKLYPSTKIVLSPDIVLSTDMRDFGITSGDRHGVLLVFRSDAEKSIDEESVNRIKEHIESLNVDCTITDTNLGVCANKNNRFDLVKEKLKEFANSELVITDRLHGMVFAAITGTPCIVFSNYNHKVTGTYDWIKDLGYIKFAKSADEAISFIPKLLKADTHPYDKNILMPFFNDLKNELKNS